MHESYRNKLTRENSDRKATKKLCQKLKKQKPKDLDDTINALDEAAFEAIDCLQCANCCRTTGPKFTSQDIERIARHQALKPGEFTKKYLRVDEDQDYVLQSVPCPFLGDDNYCSIYEVRPKACADYPHTHHRQMHKHMDLVENNATVCPAVAHIVERLKEIY
jgi:Fe-S-cluster containining protein